MLPSSEVLSCFGTFRDHEHGVQVFFSDGTLHGTAAVVPRTAISQFAGATIFLLRHVLSRMPVAVAYAAGDSGRGI